MEGFNDFGIEVEDEVLLLREFHVPVGHCFLYPVCERSTDDCVRDVHDPLPRYLVHVSLVGQVLQHALILTSLLEYIVDRKPFVLRTRQELDVVALDKELLLRAKIYKHQ